VIDRREHLSYCIKMSLSSIPASILGTMTRAPGMRPANDTTAGPGQNPASPQPQPNKAIGLGNRDVM
jgi:hypothetical protein